MLDRTYKKHIRNSKLLSDSSKNLYLKRLDVIQNEIWLNCSTTRKVGKGKCLEYIINHPEAFLDKMNEYVNKTSGRLDNNKLSIHARDGYVSAIGALFRHTPGMIQKKTELYKKWTDLHQEIREDINNQKYHTNKPSKENSYVSFEELEKTRNKQKIGSFERLLLSMYTLIPPVRSDYDKVIIYNNSDNIREDIRNYMVLSNKENYIVLREYKTNNKYKDQIINLPSNLLKEINKSLELYPRDYLFVSLQKKTELKPFEKPNSFNKWANRILKKLFDKKNITLTTLRHIYITRRDLKLEEKSGLERNKIAKQMGHSISTQQNYLWHTYANEIKK